MQPLSANYRNDDYTKLPANIKEYLDQHYLKELANLTVHHPKLLVTFSGGNAMGKSTLSQKIGEQLHGLVLENDAMKTHLLDFPHLTRDERNALTWQYSMNLYERLEHLTPNGLVVRDGLIDWYYDRILPVFKQRGYKLFVIAFDVSRAKRIALITARGDKPTISVEKQIDLLDEQDLHTKRFRAAYTPDIILNDDTLFDHDMVLERIKAHLL